MCSHRCKYCPEVFDSRGEVLAHQKKAHTRTEKSICNICGISISASYLDEHTARHELKPKFKCSKCGKLRGSKAQLHEHMKRVHDEYFCTQCGKHVRKIYEKLHNQNYHTKEEDKDFVCPIC
ncbi:MAG: C2H2-type zinc finger protein, partial [Candidatus Micropelagos thuwalensis]